MAELSQRSVAQMIRVFEKLGCSDDPFHAGMPEPLVTATELKRELYERNFDRSFLETCTPRNQYAKRRDFDRILPQLYDGRFFDPPRNFGRNWRAALEDEEAPFRRKEAVEKGRTLLLAFAEYLFDKSHTLRAPRTPLGLDQLLKSLELDGFRLHQGKLIPADTAVFDQPKQVSLLIEQIQATKPSSQHVLLHHFTNGEHAYLESKFDTAVGEWRKFFERLLRDIGEETGEHRTDLTKDAAKLTMKDLFPYLEEAGFLDGDEKLAFSSSWGFLCSGAHPDIGNEEQAYLARCSAYPLDTSH